MPSSKLSCKHSSLFLPSVSDEEKKSFIISNNSLESGSPLKNWLPRNQETHSLQFIYARPFVNSKSFKSRVLQHSNLLGPFVSYDRKEVSRDRICNTSFLCNK
jgi:hypothetical protein